MSKHIIVVYGSLMNGLHNHIILRRKMRTDQAKFLGTDVVNVPFKMVDLGSFPGLVPNDEDENASNENIFVEVYEGNDATNSEVEALENFNAKHPEKGLYRKESVETKYGSGMMYIFNNADYGSVNELVVPQNKDEIINWREYHVEQD